MIKNSICLIFLIATVTLAQHTIKRVEPPFWWKEMHNPELQIMIYGENIAELIPEIEYDGITIKRTVLVENRNYLFIYLDIKPEVTPGEITIQLKNNENRVTAVGIGVSGYQVVIIRVSGYQVDPSWFPNLLIPKS
jgi:hypothetical protein